TLGEPAPDLAVEAYVKGELEPVQLTLPEADSWTVLFFYPRDFTFVCPTERAAYEDLRPDFEELGAQLVAARTERWWVHRGGHDLAVNESRAETWAHLHELLFADSWHEALERHRSDYVFRGEADRDANLETSLQRLGGDYGQVEAHLLRNFRKYAQRSDVPAD